MEFEPGTLNPAADSSSAGAATGQGVVTPAADTDPSLSGQVAETQEEQVPFHEHPRWQAMLAKNQELTAAAEAAKAYEPFAPMLQELRDAGFSSYEAFQTHLAEQNQAQQAQQAIEQKLAATATGLLDKVNNGYVDPATGEFTRLDMATAERLFENEKQLAQTMQQQQRQAMELLDLKLGQLQAKPAYAKMNPAYVREIARATNRPLEAVAKESHDWETKREQQLLAQYNITKANDRQQTQNTPQGGGAPAPAPGGMPGLDRPQKEFDAWWTQQLRAGRQP